MRFLPSIPSLVTLFVDIASRYGKLFIFIKPISKTYINMLQRIFHELCLLVYVDNTISDLFLLHLY